MYNVCVSCVLFFYFDRLTVVDMDDTIKSVQSIWSCGMICDMGLSMTKNKWSSSLNNVRYS